MRDISRQRIGGGRRGAFQERRRSSFFQPGTAVGRGDAPTATETGDARQGRAAAAAPMIRAPVVASAADRRISDRLRSGKRQSAFRLPPSQPLDEMTAARSTARACTETEKTAHPLATIKTGIAGKGRR